jgi:hypothetical protein
MKLTYQATQDIYPKYKEKHKSLSSNILSTYQVIFTSYKKGYSGHLSNIKSENKFGESFGKESHKSLHNKIYKGSDVPPNQRYTSMMRESFFDQKNAECISTAELLGIQSRIDVYKKVNLYVKKPIPIDTINKFWGVDDKNFNDEIVKSQGFKQSEKNYWSFIESNKLEEEQKVQDDVNKSNNDYWGIKKTVQELHPELKFQPIPGYQGMNRSIVSENIYGLTYEQSRVRAKDLMDQFNLGKANQLKKTSMSHFK